MGPSEKPLFIELDIPTSPLLFSLSEHADSLLSASGSTAAPPRSALPFPEIIPPVSSSSSESLTPSTSHSVPGITITCSPSEPPHNDRLGSPPPCASPRASSRLSISASKKLVEFIDFLEKTDRDMAAEIEHVKESIREAREYVGEWQEERSARQAALSKRRERDRRETKEPDSDFWCGI
jgi:hypothetical protein